MTAAIDEPKERNKFIELSCCSNTKNEKKVEKMNESILF